MVHLLTIVPGSGAVLRMIGLRLCGYRYQRSSPCYSGRCFGWGCGRKGWCCVGQRMLCHRMVLGAASGFACDLWINWWRLESGWISSAGSVEVALSRECVYSYSRRVHSVQACHLHSVFERILADPPRQTAMTWSSVDQRHHLLDSSPVKIPHNYDHLPDLARHPYNLLISPHPDTQIQ